MSFFDNNKTVGLALVIAGLITLVMGIGNAVAGVMDGDGNNAKIAAVCFGIAALIFGILIFGYGFKVRGGPNDQSDIVSGLIRIVGVATILQALFNAIGAYFTTADSGSIATAVWAAIVSMIVSIIIGLILIWAAGKVAGNSKNVISKLLWIILVVVFLVLAVLTLVHAFPIGSGITGILVLVSAICMFFVYLYCFIAMLSKDVKSSMGI